MNRGERGPSSGGRAGGRGGSRDGRPGGFGGGQRKTYRRKKVCRYCVEPKLTIDYKDAKALKPYITDRGKIIPRRITGNCAKHQRAIGMAIKRARNVALLPYVGSGI